MRMYVETEPRLSMMLQDTTDLLLELYDMIKNFDPETYF